MGGCYTYSLISGVSDGESLGEDITSCFCRDRGLEWRDAILTV